MNIQVNETGTQQREQAHVRVVTVVVLQQIEREPALVRHQAEPVRWRQKAAQVHRIFYPEQHVVARAPRIVTLIVVEADFGHLTRL